MANGLIKRVHALHDADPGAIMIERTSDGTCWTRGQIIAEARRLGALLRRETPTGATIALESSPGHGAGFLAGILAVWGTGRRALPLAGSMPEEQASELIDRQKPAACITTGRDFGCMPLCCDFETGGEEAALDEGRHGSLLLQSSGTVGMGRVALREAEAIDNVAATLLALLGIHGQDQILSSLPMHHAYGMEHAVMLPLISGARLLQMPGFELEDALGLLRERATVLPTIPPTIEAIALHPPQETTLRLVYTAGTPLSPTTARAFARHWGIEVGDLYGATELGTITFGFNGDARPVRGVELVVVEPGTQDPDMRRAPGELGELLARSDAMFSGYLDGFGQQPVREHLCRGYFRTGDLGVMRDDGVVEVKGRLKLQFDVGGLKVNPTDLEDVLREHPEVDEVLVLPLQLSDTVTRVQARIIPKSMPSVEDDTVMESISTYARAHLPRHQVPRRIEFVQSLPRTPSGKLLRSPVAPQSD